MSEPPNDPPEKPAKKIIIDEDWKAQVEAEREALKEESTSQQAEPPDEAAAEDLPLPPPTLQVLVSSLGMQAMIALGLLRNPDRNQVETHLDQAKHCLDLIEMLRQKTEGNRTADETATIDGLLHELRLGYVAVQQDSGAQSESTQ